MSSAGDVRIPENNTIIIRRENIILSASKNALSASYAKHVRCPFHAFQSTPEVCVEEFPHVRGNCT